MPALTEPPAVQPPGNPTIVTLPAGQVLLRVHDPGWAADSFNPTAQPTTLTGGRFDSLDGDYAYTYLGGSAAAAIAETVCRDLALDGRARFVLQSRVRGRVITSVDVVRDLPILALHGAHLTQVLAPLELTKCDASEYELTRAWARSLRIWLPQVAGFAYRSRHDEDEMAWVLFEDRPAGPYPRATAALRARADSQPLDSGVGLHLVKNVLRAHNATPA